LLIDIGIDLVGKILYRDSVLASVFIKNPDRCGVTFSGSLGIRFGDILRFKQCLLTTFLPLLSGLRMVGCCELVVESPAIKIPFKLGNVTLLSIVTAHLVKNLDKYREKSIELRFADNVSFLVDIEKNTLGGYAYSALEICSKNLVIDTFRQKEIK